MVLHFTKKGKLFFGLSGDTIVVRYGQGPLLAPGLSDTVADYISLATFKTEMAEKGAPKGVMPGTDAIAIGEFGEGRVMSISPHFEKLEEQRLIWVSDKFR